ncbi:hypothetical protein SAMN06265171_11370 [Chryseobacterium rhizoplanae]|uniref:Uncharacterized protein n=1 Tax=Chryseobacterium rhizoplanae TaxID=1609531 RepID=A0A521FBG9_9FLAO|nr:hypothetical protein SAMN06265171_11370 [Chryseobacterium rhizoplanae]
MSAQISTNLNGVICEKISVICVEKKSKHYQYK